MSPRPFSPYLSARLVSLFLMGLLFTTGCQTNSLYHHSDVFGLKGWDMNDTLIFTDTLGQEAPVILHRELTLRHSNTYPYQNLWLYITTQTTDSLPVLTSINWTLAKPDGSWLGKGWGSIYTLTYELPDLIFAPSDTIKCFHMGITHGLRDSLLNGVTDVGLRIYTD